MSLGNLTSHHAVLEAIAECDRVGQETFLKKYGFQPARSYFLVLEGRRYDSKAIAGVAHGYQFPGQGPLHASEFSGGEATVKAKLEALGFVIAGPKKPSRPFPPLTVDQRYTWDDLGRLLDFKPSYLGAAGGMVPRPEFDALLLITHPGGGRSFNYEDYWDGGDLIYTGRGKVGDQVLEGPNESVATNRQHLLVFEQAAARTLRYLGEATCVRYWPARGLDAKGHDRRIYRFQLHFEGAQQRTVVPPAAPGRREKHRQPRPFDESRQPTTFEMGTDRASPEETLVLREKATRAHHALLVSLKNHLELHGWTEIQEIPAAVDLWARRPRDHKRVIFEAKTLSGANGNHQSRIALAQLLEYRFFFGTPEDELCLVVDAILDDARVRFLESAQVAVLHVERGSVRGVGRLGGLLIESSANA